MSALAPILVLSAIGACLAGGAALLVRRLGREGGDRRTIGLVGAIGLLLACALPFAWMRFFGPGG